MRNLVGRRALLGDNRLGRPALVGGRPTSSGAAIVGSAPPRRRPAAAACRPQDRTAARARRPPPARRTDARAHGRVCRRARAGSRAGRARTSPRAATSMCSIFGECSGNVRSTPTPNESLRTVNVSRTPSPWRLSTTPSKTCVRRRVPSMTWKWTRRRSPAWKRGTRAELRALEAVDDRAHGREKFRAAGLTNERAEGRAAYFSGPSARRRLSASRHSRTRAWWPESSTAGTVQPRHVAGRV